MLAQRQRRWPNIKQTVGQCLKFLDKYVAEMPTSNIWMELIIFLFRLAELFYNQQRFQQFI